MVCVRSTINHIFENIGRSGYVITPADVMIVVAPVVKWLESWN